jgi:hypothetical protein
MLEPELRAKIRELMASGALPSEPSVVYRGTGDLGAVKNPLPGPCSVCGERDPQITLFYVGGRVVRLHAACDALWQQERQAKSS